MQITKKIQVKIDKHLQVLPNIDQLWTNLIQKVSNSPKTLEKLCKIEQIFNEILFNGILLWPNRFWTNRQICCVDGQALSHFERIVESLKKSRGSAISIIHGE